MLIVIPLLMAMVTLTDFDLSVLDVAVMFTVPCAPDGIAEGDVKVVAASLSVCAGENEPHLTA